MIKNIMLICALSGAVLISSCAKQKMTRTWKLSEYYEDGEDKTSEIHILLPNYRITFHDNGDFEETAMPFGIETSVTGTWEFADGKSKIKLFPDSEGNRVYDCNKLTSSELHVVRHTDHKEDYRLVAVD